MFDELKKLFIQEVSDLLAKTEKDLLQLESDNINVEVLQDISRTMHTIKGSAGVYNLEKTILISHNFENLFVKIMEGKLNVTNEIISLALYAKDILLKLIEADNENDIEAEIINEIMNKIDKINEEIENNEDLIKKASNKNLNCYYILFEPNKDIEKRGIKIDSILKDFDEFDYKIITEYEDKDRRLNNKLEKYYEIIVASSFSADDLNAIFLFVPNEYLIEKISDFNIFNSPDFLDFYNNAVKITPDFHQHFELILNFSETIANQIKEKNDEQIEEKPEEILIGADEIILKAKKESKNIQYIKVPAVKLDQLLNQVSE